MFIPIAVASAVAGVLVSMARHLGVSARSRSEDQDPDRTPVLESGPMVQLLGAVSLAALLVVCASASASVPPVLALAWGVFAATIVVQVTIDLRTRTLPRRLSHAGLLVMVVAVAFGGSGDDLARVLLGALLMTSITAVLLVLSRGSLGLGDLHFSPLLGAAIGWYAPSLVMVAWVLSSLSAALILLVLLSTGRVTRRTRIPYGPFLAFGTTAAICIGAVR